ncbi:hypothetical protein Tco_0115932 [Tanacetum coccineum]
MDYEVAPQVIFRCIVEIFGVLQHASSSGAHEGTGVTPGVPDVPDYESDDEQISWKSSEEEYDEKVNQGMKEVNEEDSFDPRVQTPSYVESTDDDNSDEEEQKILCDTHRPDYIPGGQQSDSSVLSGFVATSLVMFSVTTIDEPPLVFATTLPLPPTPLIIHMQQTLAPTPTIVPSTSLIEKTVNEQLEAKVMTHSSTESKTSLAIAANLSELELKKIPIEKMESNKSIYRSNEQKESLPGIDDEDKDEEPSAGSNWGSKRRCAGKEPESTSAPKEKTSKTTGKSNEGPPTPDRDWNKTLPADHGPVQPWLSNLARQENPRDSFDELTDTPFDFLALQDE